MVLNHVAPLMTIAWLPLIIIEVYIFGLGLAFFLSALFVKFRDIQYIWELFMQAGFYLTPILYPLTQIHNVLYQKLIFMNPMAQAIQDARYSVISHDKAIITTWRVFDGGWYAFIPFRFHRGCRRTGGVAYFRINKTALRRIYKMGKKRAPRRCR
jgi:ABC-2 type transport system permease protein